MMKLRERGIWREQQEEGGKGILDQQMVKHGNIIDDDKRKSRKRVRGSIGVSFQYYLYTIAVPINLLLELYQCPFIFFSLFLL